MKRRDLVRHLETHNCRLHREGANHSIYRHPANSRCAAVPRHSEVKETVARTMCEQLGVPRP